MNLSQDETKVVLTILKQLSYNFKDARVVLPIIEKLEGSVSEPNLTVTDSPSVETKEVDTEKIVN